MTFMETTVSEVDGYSVGIIRFRETMEVLSCAVLNGGDSEADALFIMQVPKDYSERDPKGHAVRVRDALGLPSNSVGMMTAAEVGRVMQVSEGEYRGTRVEAVVTAGLSNHVVAGDVLDNYPERRKVSDMRGARMAGTINIAVVSPVPLTMEGKVNMFIPLTEGKSAALADRGYRETGTTTDSMAVFCPKGDDRVDYTGTGSDIGIATARAVRSGVGKALEVRGEHPVMEEPIRLLRNWGFDIEDLMELSGKDVPEDEFISRFKEVLGKRDVRALLDLALFCADRADSMAEDGCSGDSELIMRSIEEVTGQTPDPSWGVSEGAVASICRMVGEMIG